MEYLEEKNDVIKAELQPLILPEGIQEDELSKVIINILLRRALCEKSPLSKWVLLGALEVIQGRTPKLTATMLSQLVNISQKSEESKLFSNASVNNQDCNKNKASSITYVSVGSQVDLDSKELVDKSSQANIVAITKDMDVQCEPLTHNKEVQCQPSVRTNWAQTLMKPKLVTKGSQTPLKKPKGDVDYYVNLKYKGNNIEVRNSPKLIKSKLDVGEILKHKKSNGVVDNQIKIDTVETIKLNTSTGENEKSLKNNQIKAALEHTLKLNRVKGGKENSPNNRNTKEVADGEHVENSLKINKINEDDENNFWKLIKVDGVPKQKKQANRLELSSSELDIPLFAKSELQDPRLLRDK